MDLNGRWAGPSLHAAALASIAALAAALYVPYLGNGLVFDDQNLFGTGIVYDYAQRPFSFTPRNFPYFTLGLTQVLFGSIAAQRIVSLGLHVFCGWALYMLCLTLLRAIPDRERGRLEDGRCRLASAIVALLFVVHPVAVYGAGYLVERTILFATLFSLLSIWFYLRGVSQRRFADLITAGLFFGLAVLSKEHSIMLPAAAVAMTPLIAPDRQGQRGRALAYLAFCAPFIAWALLYQSGFIGRQYEPDTSKLVAQMGAAVQAGSALERWWVSAVTQMGLFFDYIRCWFLPDVRAMSIDMRVDFSAFPVWPAIVKVLAFFACPLLSLRLLAKQNRASLFGAGLLYCWLLYMTELSVVRFQEPFVLYRSYLWAPGYLLMVLAPLSMLGRKAVLVAAVLAQPALFLSAQNRLDSLADEYHVWQDAAAKLADDNIAGAGRIHYNRGRALFMQQRYREAVADMERVSALHPELSEPYRYKGLAAMAEGNYVLALECFDQAVRLDPNVASIHTYRGRILERLGRDDEALAAYAKSLGLGNQAANASIRSLSDRRRKQTGSLPLGAAVH